MFTQKNQGYKLCDVRAKKELSGYQKKLDAFLGTGTSQRCSTIVVQNAKKTSLRITSKPPKKWIVIHLGRRKQLLYSSWTNFLHQFGLHTAMNGIFADICPTSKHSSTNEDDEYPPEPSYTNTDTCKKNHTSLLRVNTVIFAEHLSPQTSLTPWLIPAKTWRS